MSLTLGEARARAGLIDNIETVVHLDLTSTEHYTVNATIRFTCGQPGAGTFLELAHAQEVTVDGKAIDYDGRRIDLVDLGTHNEVVVVATMPYVNDGDGMTVTVDPVDGERYVCGFTAMDVAQKVIPCFDQPDLKSTFDVSVTAPSHWTVTGERSTSSATPTCRSAAPSHWTVLANAEARWHPPVRRARPSLTGPTTGTRSRGVAANQHRASRRTCSSSPVARSRSPLHLGMSSGGGRRPKWRTGAPSAAWWKSIEGSV